MRVRTLAVAATAAATLIGCQRYEVDPVKPAAARVEQKTFKTLKQISPNVIFVVDKSGSMDDPAGSGQAQSKWDDLVQVMTQDDGSGQGFVSDLAARGTASDPVRMGMVAFPSDNYCGNGVLKVDPGPSGASQIDQAFGSLSPGGGTPTAASLQVAGNAFQSVYEADRPNFIVLMTDGAPNCNQGWSQIAGNTTDKCQEGTDYCSLGSCCYSGTQDVDGCAPEGCLDDVNLAQTVQALAQSQYKIGTFVIGFGSDVSDPNSLAYQTLDDVAVAGGHPQDGPNNGEPKFYSAQSQTDLANALTAILNVITANCQYPLDAAPPSPDAVEVVLTTPDGKQHPLSYNSDYTVDVQSQTVQINDVAPENWCSAIKAATAANPITVQVAALGD